MNDPRATEESPSDLSPAELELWLAFRSGDVCDLRTGEAELDDPADEHLWGPERTVRARIIALLLLHGPPPRLGRVASLHLAGAYVTGVLDLSGGMVEPHFEVQRCRFEHEVRLSEARVNTVRLVDCSVPRLDAARLTTEGDLDLSRCSVPGGIKLTDATIGTDLLLNEADVGARRGPRSRAVDADGLAVSADLHASLLRTNGEMSLRGATIGGSLNMSGAALHNSTGPHALYAPRMTVEHVANLGDARPHRAGGDRRQRFECTGGVALDDGRFGSSLVIENARITLRQDQELSLRRIQAPELTFTPLEPERGLVVLSGATVEKLLDRAASWPHDGRLMMTDFSYRLAVPKEGHFNVHERIAWVRAATPEFSPGPYAQLAAMYRNSGEDTNARAVLLAQRRHRRGTLPLLERGWEYLLDWTVAYGYQPTRAALFLLVLAIGALALPIREPATFLLLALAWSITAFRVLAGDSERSRPGPRTRSAVVPSGRGRGSIAVPYRRRNAFWDGFAAPVTFSLSWPQRTSRPTLDELLREAYDRLGPPPPAAPGLSQPSGRDGSRDGSRDGGGG